MAWEHEVAELVHNGVLSITQDGHVYRHRRVSHGKLVDLQTPRRIDIAGNKGYRRLHVQIGGKVRNVGVHRLIWTIHNGPIVDRMQINHINGTKDDNRLENLEVVSPSGNIRHSYDKLGRPRPWHKAREWRPGQLRLTRQQRDEIRTARAQGRLLREIAADFGISTSHVHRIASSGKEVRE